MIGGPWQTDPRRPFEWRTVVGPDRGEWVVDPDNNTAAELAGRWPPNDFDAAIFRVYDRYVRPGDLVLDVGGNLGVHAVYLARDRGARVVTFEPQPPMAQALRMNAGLNGCAERVTVLEMALYDRSCWLGLADKQSEPLPLDDRGRLRYDAFHRQGYLRLVPQNAPGADSRAREGFPACRLDALAFGWCPKLVKVDAEGADGRILFGMSALIDVARPVIVFEWADGAEEQHGLAYECVCDYLRQRDYRLERVDGCDVDTLAVPA